MPLELTIQHVAAFIFTLSAAVSTATQAGVYLSARASSLRREDRDEKFHPLSLLNTNRQAVRLELSIEHVAAFMTA